MERTKQSMSMRKRWAGRAQQGASMPLALLLFLVCATLASVVLVAATTAAGQATSLTKNNQGYYSVTSAAKLFRDKLDGQTVVITKTTTRLDTVTTTYKNAEGANTSETKTERLRGQESPGEFEIDGHDGTYFDTNKPTLLQLASHALIDNSVHMPGQYTLQASVPGNDAVSNALTVKVEPKMLDETTIALTFKKGESQEDEYQLILKLTADRTNVERSEETPGEITTTLVENTGEYKSTQQVEVETTQTTTITWSAAELSLTDPEVASS